MNSRKLYKAQRLLARTPGLITRERVRRILLSSGLRPSPELLDELMVPAVASESEPVEKPVKKPVEKPAAKKVAPKADKPKAPAKKKTARKSAAKKTEEVSNG